MRNVNHDVSIQMAREAASFILTMRNVNLPSDEEESKKLAVLY